MKKPLILVADDDPEDCLLAKEALEESEIAKEVKFVRDGEELIEYLSNLGKYKNKHENPLPELILLDLNMPRKDGREALDEIKKNPEFKNIPVVVLSTSNRDEDVMFAYNYGATSFITKPSSFSSFVDILKVIHRYWLDIVRLPHRQ